MAGRDDLSIFGFTGFGFRDQFLFYLRSRMDAGTSPLRIFAKALAVASIIFFAGGELLSDKAHVDRCDSFVRVDDPTREVEACGTIA
jgi:hypothetical protein